MTDERSKQLISALREYIEKCNADKERRKDKGPFPNVCGYCRYMGIGINKLSGELKEEEALSDRIATVLEDAVINSDPSAGVLSHCIRLVDRIRTGKEEDGITVIFSHGDGEEEAS